MPTVLWFLKSVGIYGITDPRSYRPWVPGGEPGVDYAVVRSDLPCACRFPLAGGITLPAWIPILLCPALDYITPAQVLEAALAVARANLPAQPGTAERPEVQAAPAAP